MNIEKYKELNKFTLKKALPELVLKNGNIIFVQSGEIIKSDIAIQDGYIIGIGNYNGLKEIDLTGKFISPGFIDAHLHFESTLSKPDEFIHHASLSGTTTFIADPHETANVSGLDGINFIIDQTEDVSGNVFIMLPSCVPCVSWEENGVKMNADSLKHLVNHPRVLGLGEVMDYNAVINCENSIIDKLNLFENNIDGHAPFLTLEKLCAYSMAGISTDHECSDYEYAINHIRNGLHVHIREGSAAKNLETLVSGIIKNKVDTRHFSFCTDDKHIKDIKCEGHISYNIKKSIELGLNPIKAYQMATINTANCYNLKDLGVISSGKQADLVILNDLEKVEIDCVLYKGKFIEKNYKSNNNKINNNLLNTVNIDWFKKEHLNHNVDDFCYGIEMVENEILTKKIKISKAELNDFYNGDNKSKLSKVVLIERHNNTKHFCISYIKGYNIKNGAIAISVSHDSHNVIVIGDNDFDINLAIEKMKELQGGYILVSDGKHFNSISLSIMGLMSTESNETLAFKLDSMIKKAHLMGVPKKIEPFISLSFIALPVIPEVRITSLGLYDILNEKFI